MKLSIQSFSGVWISSQRWWGKYAAILIMLIDTSLIKCALALSYLDANLNCLDTFTSKLYPWILIHLPILIGIVIKSLRLVQKWQSHSDESSDVDFSVPMSSLQDCEFSFASNQVRAVSIPTTPSNTKIEIELSSWTNKILFGLLSLTIFGSTSVKSQFFEAYLDLDDYLLDKQLITYDEEKSGCLWLAWSPVVAILFLILIICIQTKYPWPLVFSSIPVLIFGIVQKYPKLVWKSWQLNLLAFSLCFLYLLIPLALFYFQHLLGALFKPWQMFILVQVYIFGQTFLDFLDAFHRRTMKVESFLYLMNVSLLAFSVLLVSSLLVFKCKN